MAKQTLSLFNLFCMLWLCVRSISAAVVDEWTLHLGDTITLYCNVGSDAITVEWNYTPPNQLKSTIISGKYAPPPFRVLENYNLRIENITEQDHGFYYCSGFTSGTAVNGTIYKVSFHDYFPHPTPGCPPPCEQGVSWTVLFTVCPIAVLLSAAASSILVYCLVQKNVSKEKELNQEPKKRTGSRKQEEDICYASLDLPSTRRKQKAKKKREESTDFCTYSEVRGAAK